MTYRTGTELGTAIANALGINPDDVTRIELIADAADVAQVRVTHLVKVTDAELTTITRALATYELHHQDNRT